MSQDLKKLCARYDLVYVETSELGIKRRRCGKGFTYLGATGKVIHDRGLRLRIKGLAIPPAWTEVCIAENDKAHIQAIGRDGEGRLQYRYHPNWEAFRGETKAKRLMRLGTALPRLRARVRAALSAPGLSRAKVIAAVVRLIDRALLRPGYEEYARKTGGRGAATLMKSDVAVSGDTVVLEFEGKGGKEIKREIHDPLLAPVLRALSRAKGQRLFVAPDAGGGDRAITAREVNAFLAEAGGADVSAKDFRTFRASAVALSLLTERNGHESERSRKKAIVQAADAASEMLANTRTVARSSYIHPSVIKAYETGKLETSLLRGRVRNGLNKIESALMRFLERSK